MTGVWVLVFGRKIGFWIEQDGLHFSVYTVRHPGILASFLLFRRSSTGTAILPLSFCMLALVLETTK